LSQCLSWGGKKTGYKPPTPGILENLGSYRLNYSM
jgi:hypothetical protein